MKFNIALLRGRDAVPEFPVSRAASFKQNRRFDRQRDAQASRAAPRPVLVMNWRVHPSSGRLECQWALEGSAAADEDVSCGIFLRQAA